MPMVPTRGRSRPWLPSRWPRKPAWILSRFRRIPLLPFARSWTTGSSSIHRRKRRPEARKGSRKIVEIKDQASADDRRSRLRRREDARDAAVLREGDRSDPCATEAVKWLPTRRSAPSCAGQGEGRRRRIREEVEQDARFEGTPGRDGAGTTLTRQWLRTRKRVRRLAGHFFWPVSPTGLRSLDGTSAAGLPVLQRSPQ